MKNKSELIEILRMADIDELWVNFDNPFTVDHASESEKIILLKKDAFYGDADLVNAGQLCIAFFAPLYNSDIDEEVASVHLNCITVSGNEDLSKKIFESNVAGCHLLYTKEDGILGTATVRKITAIQYKL